MYQKILISVTDTLNYQSGAKSKTDILFVIYEAGVQS